jgi:hypothetical protein
MQVTEDCCNSNIRPVCEAIEGHDNLDAYYRFKPTSDISLYLSDAQRRQLLDVLSSAPPLPKTDAQIDAEAEAARNIPVSALPNWRGGPDAEF